MADLNKAEKLAAARKKLKEYQQKSKDSQPSGIKTSGNKIITKPQLEGEEVSVEQNSVFDSEPLNVKYNEIVIEPSDNNKLQNIVNSSLETQIDLDMKGIPEEIDTYHTMTNDKLNESEIKENNILQDGEVNNVQKHTYEGLSDIFSINSVPVSTSVSPFPSLNMSDEVLSSHANSFDIMAARQFFDNISTVSQKVSADIITIPSDFKETDQNRIGHQMLPTDTVTPSSEDRRSIADESQASLTFILEESNPANCQESQVIDNKMNQIVVESQNGNLETLDQHAIVNTFELLSTTGPLINSRSTSESLRQLSRQMNGLIEESAQDSVMSGGDSELERRNQELAGMLAAEKQKSEQLELQLKEYQSGVCQLQLELDQLRTESEARVTREIGVVQEQLQLHVQTVGILVGEKTELQAALAKSQNVAKQKAVEAEELQGRLKASRHRVLDLEKEVSLSQETTEKIEKMTHDLSSELDKLKREHGLTKKQLVETEEEVSELHQKLNTKMNDCVMLQQELQEKLSQLSLTQLRVQQLSTTDTSEIDGQLESLHQQNVSLEKQVIELQQTIKLVGSERDQASQQYQQYVQQLNGQLQSFASKIESLGSENEQLLTREQNMVRHVSELEKQLQQQQQQNQKRRDSPPKSVQQDSNALQELETKLKLVEGEKQTLAEKLDSQLQENQNIQRELEEHSSRIEELESILERLEGDQPDKNKLLAAMESDKVAAARAVGQNQRLKQQLEELQGGFVKMSNNKLELTEQLQHEQHICKEQGERLVQQEEELKDLRTQLMEKEQQLQQNSSELSNHMLQHSHIANRMRHYEAHGQLNELLQQELEQSKDRIQALSTQNSELRILLAQQSTHDSGSSSGAGSLDDAISRKDEMLATLSASVRQLELERDQLLERLKHLEHVGKEENFSQLNPSANKNVLSSLTGDENPKDFESMKVAMEQLEERFTKTMKEVADLSDEKQRLEHLVLQLQGETETIGEYIALYQVQRSILRQRAQEKDEQLSKLSKDREEMRNKLGELNELVRRLVAEKEAIRKISYGIPVEHIAEQTPVKLTSQMEEGIPNGEIADIEKVTEVNGDTQIIPSSGDHLHPVLQADTAGKIMALLSEIGTSSLVDPQCSENFHPCPWCSGRLLTV